MLPILFAMPVIGFDLRDAIKRAQERAGVGNDCVASAHGISEQQFCAWLNNESHYSLQRLIKAYDDPATRPYVIALWLEVGSHFGIHEPAIHAELAGIKRAMLTLIDRVQAKVMAKAEIRDRKERVS